MVKSKDTRLRVGAVWRWTGALRFFLTLHLITVPAVVAAQSITADGRTQTTVTTQGAVTSVTTATIQNANAFNSFSTFSVGPGTTANLYLPGGTQNLINLVRDQRTDVYGILNAIKDGRIGGNVWFANPHGFVVGPSGVVNVGSLSVATPTQQFVDGFFLAPGLPDQAAVAQLLAGTAPRSGTGLISIQGKVNAGEGVSLGAGAIDVAGSIYSGARFVGSAPDFTDVVNANGLESASGVIVSGGRIRIVADNDVTVSGTIAAPAGAVEVRAGGNAAFLSGASIDVNAGAIEFSARGNVELAGGELRAGSVLIDPATVTVSADLYAGGATYTIAADETITVNPGIVVSTRNVAGGAAADQEAAASIGDSGNLTLQAPSITLGTGSKLLSHGIGFGGGDITLTAARTDGGDTLISIDGARLKGANVTLSAASSYASTLLPVVLLSPHATIDVNSSRLEATAGNVSIGAFATVDVTTPSVMPLATVGVDSAAAVQVRGASQIVASGGAQLMAASAVSAKALPGMPDLGSLPGDAAVAINVVGSHATVHVGDTSSVDIGGALKLGAANAVSVESKADAGSGSAVVGGMLALSVVNATTGAYIDGAATVIRSGSVEVAAESANTVVGSAKATTGGATQKGAAQSQTEKSLADYKDQASSAEGSVEVAAAVAISDLTATNQAYIASSAPVNSTGAVTVSSGSRSDSSVTADGSSASGTVGVGAAVALNVGVGTNLAFIGDDAQVSANGLTVSALTPAGEKSDFSAEAKSGAGAKNVGVAGSLAANVAVNTTAAYLERDLDASGLGASVAAGTGDVLIEAKNDTTSTVKSGADVKGSGDTATVGIGASVGMNVAVNTTVAEIGDGAQLTGGHDLTLKASADHTMGTTVSGGAAGSKVSVTPLAAVSIGVNTTIARLGASTTGLGLSGAYSSLAEQASTQTTTATGQTQGNNVAVGASVGLGIATDTVSSSVERDLTATGAMGVEAKSTAKSSTSATASVKGGHKADDNDKPTTGDPATPAKTVDEQVTAQDDAAKATDDGLVTDEDLLAAFLKLNIQDPNSQVNGTKAAPKTDDGGSGGAVSVAAAVGVDVGVATTTASIGQGRTVNSGGALSVKSTAQTDASATADGSQVDAGGTNVGVGAAVALNVGVATNVASIGEDSHVSSKGLTVSALSPTGEKSDFSAEAKSGAGAKNVGVAGSLAANVAVNTTVAALEADKNANGLGADVNAGTGDVLIEAKSDTTSTVKSGADVKGSGDGAAVGVGASLGMNVAVNTTVAEVGDAAKLTGGNNLTLKAGADHTLSTEVTGGAAGAKVAVTPLAAVSVGVNTTVARLGTSATGLGLSGAYSGLAEQSSVQTTTATGQTEGSDVAVGASVGLGIATDTVSASVERDITATGAVGVEAKSTAKSATSATASVKGGEKADAATDKPPSGDAGTVDKQVTAQGDAAKAKGQAAGGAEAGSKLQGTKAPPKGETSEGGVSVAAAVAANVGVATSTASIGQGRTVTSGGALSVKSTAQTDASAKADGSQVDAGGTDVGVGAAVALNVGVATNHALIGDNASVTANGLTVSALTAAGEKNDFAAEAKSGAGAKNVGVAGSLAANIVVNTTAAYLEKDLDASGLGASVAAGTGDVLIEAKNDTTSTVKSGADVKGSDDAAKVGVGASVGLNVAVNTTVAELGDEAKLTGGKNLTLEAGADHTMSTEVTGGAAGAKVSITPVVAASIGVNTTSARLGESATGLGLSGALSVRSEQTNSATTKATGQAQGDVAVGASLAAAVVIDNVSASLERNVTASSAIDLDASSKTSIKTEAVAGAKGAKAAEKDTDGNEKLAPGTTVDEQKKTQLDFAKSRNEKTATLDTDSKTPAAETPAVNKNETPVVDKDQPPQNPPADKEQAKKVSVAAAIGVSVAANQARASIGAGRSLTTTGDLNVKSATDTNYATKASGEAVSDDIGVAAAVALTATYNRTQATLGAGASVAQADDVSITATAKQNRDAAFLTSMSSEAVSGASGGEVAVAGALAVVGNYNETRASIDEGATIGTNVTPVGDIAVEADETSKIAAQARAGALSKGGESKAGVGASFAVLLSANRSTAAVGFDTTAPNAASNIHANSLTVTAAKNRVEFNPLPNIGDVKTFSFDTLDPSTYLGSNNYYTEAVAGAASKGTAAVAGAFSVDLFTNVTESYLGSNVNVTSYGSQPENLGVQVSSRSGTKAIAFAGAVAGAKKAGVGVSNTDIVNYDETLASIGSGSTVKSTAPDAGVKVASDAEQDIANAAVSGAAATGGAGVAGVLGVLVSMNKSAASIGEGATVESAGDVTVKATNDSATVLVAGGVAGGKEVGVGGAIAANVLWNRTHASIGTDAGVDAKKTIAVQAQAHETAANAVVAGAGGGKAGVAAALSINAAFTDTEAFVGEAAQLNTEAAFANAAQRVSIGARDDTVIVGVAGGGAGGGKAGVGAALDTTVLAKTVKAYIADDTVDDGKAASVNALTEVALDAAASESMVSVAAGFAGGGSAGVGGAVSIGVVVNDVQAYVGKSASVDSDGNVLINAEDDTTAVLTAGSAAGGGSAGVGGSLAVATLIGSTKAYVGESASVNARGNREAASVYAGETVVALSADTPTKPGDLLAKKKEDAKGLSVTAYSRENLITTVASGAGGGSAGVAATVSADVIARTTEAYIGRSARINESNTAAGAEQQVRVKAVDESLLVDTAAGAGGGGSAGVGAAANVGVIAKTTRAWIGQSALVNAKQAVELDAASSAISFGTTAGFAGGGSAGVGGAVGVVGVVNTTAAYIEDATSALSAAKVTVTGGDLRLNATDLATSWLLTGAGAGGGAAGVGGSLAVGVNASTTEAKIGDYAETNASGTTEVHADSTENVNTITVAGAGGGSAGVAGTIGVNVVVSKTEAGIGDNAKVNQLAAGQNVEVKATDRIVTIGAGGAGAGGGAAGVGGTAVVTVALNTTSAYIGNSAQVDAVKDVSVAASSDKYVNSATVAGAGGGAAGVAGAVSILSVGSFLDGEAKSGLTQKDDAGNPTSTTQGQADGQTTKSAVGNELGSSAQSVETKGVLDSNAAKLAVGKYMEDATPIPLRNTQAFIGHDAVVSAGENVSVTASDKTLAILASGAGAGGGAAGVAGSLGVVLLHDAAEAFIADGAQVDAGKTLTVAAETGETVVNLGITGSGAGAAGVSGSIVVNVVSADTFAYIGDADINQGALPSTGQSVVVTADSTSNLFTVAGSGSGAGAAAVGGVLNVNTLFKDTKAYIGEGANVAADREVEVSAESGQNIIAGGVSIRGAGAAAVGAVASANVVANTTEAFIGAARDDLTRTAAVVDSDGNVKLAATDDTLIVAVSGVGNGAGAAGVGVNVGANVVSSETRAYVSDNSTVNARGNADGTDVYSGAISATPGAMPALPAGQSGDVDINRDGVADGNVSNGATFDVKAEGESDGSGGADSTVNPATAKSSDGGAIAGAAGGLGAKGVDAGVKGLSVVAVGNEKMITAAVGVAGAGAAAVTGAASANVVSSVTEATIGDATMINTVAGGADPSVRVRAADNTFMVQVTGTVSGAGAAAVSGAANAGIVTKQVHARIGDAEIEASDVEVSAASSEALYTVTTNLSVAGAAGVGAAVGVDVIRGETLAAIGAGANIDATGDIRVLASQDSAIDLYTFAGAGGIVGVSGAVSVGVIDNTTKAYVEGSTSTSLDAAGTTEIKADASEDITTVTVSAAGGGVGVAGAVAVRIVGSETAAFIGEGARVNQARNGAAQDVIVAAADNVTLKGGGGAAAVTGLGGAGATAEVNIVRNTTTAYIGESAVVDADRDVSVTADSVKSVQSAAVAAAGGFAVGVGGAVSVVSIGAKLDGDSQASLRDSGGSGANTAGFVDTKLKEDRVSGELGDSEHVQGTKTDISGRMSAMGVAADLNDESTTSLDKTRAYIGGGSRVTAGGSVKVAASDRIKVDVNAVGAGGGVAGIGAAIGVAIANSTTEAFIGGTAHIDAGADVDVAADAGNVDATGANVRAAAGAGGVVGASAAVAVMSDTSTTQAYLGGASAIEKAKTLSVAARTDRAAQAQAYGAAAGGLAIGASIARADFDGSTSAYFEPGVLIGKTSGKTVDDVFINATDESTASATAVAGTAGILAGSGADARATVASEVAAAMGSGSQVAAQDQVSVSAAATTQTDARAMGVNIGAGAVGASLATALSNATVSASLGTGTEITAAQLDVLATRSLGAGPSALAEATGASGGLLLGVNATVAKAESTGHTSAQVGDDSTLAVTGVTTVASESVSQQSSSGLGLSAGFIAVGADYSRANSATLTEATLGDRVKVTGGTLQVIASSDDRNYAYGLAGSGGVASAPFSEASTSNTSQTYARTGSGDNVAGTARKIDVASLVVSAGHAATFDSWMDSTNASLIGVSGAKAANSVDTRSEAYIGTAGYVEADDITLQAHNDVSKARPAAAQIPGLTRNVPAWNVDSSSGGLADVPAAGSVTTITTNALVQVGAGAHLEQTGSASSPGVYSLDAWNSVKATDKVRMSSGGAVSAASAKSAVIADHNDATVAVGGFAQMSSVGDMALGARSVADLYTQAAVDVYGAVGVAPAGDSVSRFLAGNSIDIGAGATMQSLHDIKLSAGAGTAGAANDVKATARTDVYNNTAIPVNRDPVADAVIGTHSQITVGSGADVAAVRHVTLSAEEGTAAASGVGIGKDIYREILAAIASAISNLFGGGDVSFETRTGRSIEEQTSDVQVDGGVRVGIHRKQELVIGPDGTPTRQTDGISITSTGFRDIAADILSRINDLEELIRQYTVADPTADASIAVAAYRSEIRFLERKLAELGFPRGASGTPSFSGVAGISPRQAAQEAVAGMTATRQDYDTQRTSLSAENASLASANATLTSANTTLTSTNASLTSANTTLASQNTTLISANAALQVQLDGLPAGHPGRASLQSQIDANNATIAGNNTTIAGNNATIDGNTSTINSNTATINSNTATINSNSTQLTQLDGQIGNLDTQISSVQIDLAITDPNDPRFLSPVAAGGPVAKFLTISDSLAQLGNIYVRGDRLHGSGTLEAPGDAQIKITNNGPNFLVLKDLTIPPDEGGKVYFNSVDVKSNAEINNVNGAAGGADFSIFTAESQFDASGNPVTPGKPSIVVESKYDPLDPLYIAQTPPNTPTLAPDIILQGDISNLRGLVKIDSAAGSIRLEQKRDSAGAIIPGETASIRADDVEVATRNGDFVQSYTDGFFHTAGAPLTTIPGDPNLAFPGNIARIDRTPESAGSGIVANGSVLIAARYLNINGNIQSGIPEWGVRVPADATVTIGTGSGSFAQARAHYNALSPAQQAVLGAEFYEVSGATVSGLAGNVQGEWEKIPVRYNAKEDRLELVGVRVQGGYIELFGQIFNTSQGGGGKLRVMDGYGQIRVDNQTSLPLWVNVLDTGRGVSGQINITNITGIRPEGSVDDDGNPNGGTPIIATTTFTRNPGASRIGDFYDPTAGLRYVMTVGYDTARVDYYRYSQKGVFGIDIVRTKVLDQYKIKSEVRTNAPLSQGVFLREGPVSNEHYIPANPALYAPGSITGGQQQTRQTDQSDPVLGRSWRDCNWWTLCILSTHYQEYTVTKGFKTTITDSVKGDYPIAIEYIGFDQGAISVGSTGNVVMNAAINNRNGDTSVASAGSITQSADLPIIRGNNVTLSAGTGMGAAAQSLLVNVNDGGKLEATSNSGEVRVAQVVGDLRIGAVGGAGVANVVLEADRSLLPWDGASYVQGQRVELVSHNGGIGTLSGTVNDPLVVRTGYTTNQAQWPNNGLKASARDSINIRNVGDAANPAVYSGNLLLIGADSLSGDVRIETTGAVIDNNPFATTDLRTQEELANLWDSLRLRGALAVEKADQAVAAFENGKTNNYRLYWLLRARQPDHGAAYDPGFQYTPSQAESDALAASGMSAAQIAQFAADRTSQYHQLHSEVGGFTGSYVAGFHYEATAAEEAQIRKGSSWTDAQLALSVGAGLLKGITDTVTTIKEPNATGRSITLVAGSDIGSFNAPLTIDLSADLDTLTTEQKAALAAAERGDAVLAGDVITLTQPRPVNVTVGTGALNATAGTGLAFIGSEQDLRIDRVAAAGDVRIKTAGSLVNAASVSGASNVIGGNMILEAANGGMALRIEPSSAAGVIARAAGDLWLEAAQDVAVDTMFSRNNLRLDAAGSILDYHAGESAIAPDNNLRGNNITLTAQTGTIGTPDNPLDAGVNPAGSIAATASGIGNGVYLNGPAGESFNIGSVSSGDAVALSSATGMKIDGPITGPGTIQLVAGADMVMTPNAKVHATALGLLLDAGTLTMSDGASMQIDVGTVDIRTVGDAVITGIFTGNPTESAISVVSTAGRILDGGDSLLDIIADTPAAAKLTISGALGVGADPLEVRLLTLNASSGGVVDLAVQGSVNIETIQAADRVLLTASGPVTGNSVVSTGRGSNPDKTISVTSATAGVNLANVSGTTDVTLAGPGDVSVGTLNAGSSLHLRGNNVTATVIGGAQPLTGSITGYAGAVASNVNLTLSGPAGFAFSDFWAANANVNILAGEFSFLNGIIVDRATVSNPQTSILIDQHDRSLQPFDVQLYSGGAPFSLSLWTNHVYTDAMVINADSRHEVLEDQGRAPSAVGEGYEALAQAGRGLLEPEEEEEKKDDEELITFGDTPVSLDE